MGDEAEFTTLRELIERRSANRPTDTYLEDARSDRLISYAELGTSTRDWQHTLDSAGIVAGGRVLLDLADPLDLALAYLGVVAAGRCAVPIDPTMPDAEYTRALETLRPVAAVGARLGSDSTLPHLTRLSAGPATTGEPTGPGQVRLRTSGSTGNPKVVELTEGQLLHVARAIATHNGLTPADRGFNPLPLFHINGEVVALLATLVGGATLVLDGRFHRDGFWALIDARRITWINAAPAILTILSREPIPPRPAALRLVRSASAALPVSVRETVTAALGEIVIESYGMTEAASQITATRPGETPPPGSAGRPVAVELQVRTPAGEPAPIGEIGEVWLRGGGVIDHYVDGRAADRFDADGWLDSGDLGHLDHDGYLFLAGRTDDVINRGGQLVYPREIEEALLADTRVLDAIVVGRPDEILGAVPIAYVIARDELDAADLDSLVSDLEQRCQQQLSRYKRPAAVQLVDDLPRAATGKIRRNVVAQSAVHEHVVSLVR